MHLYIILPHYNESEEVCFPMLESLNNQSEINFEDITILICKTSLQFPFPDITKYNNIKSRCILIGEWNQVESCGTARNLGLKYISKIENSDSPEVYITFMDSDDYIATELGLKAIFDTLTSKKDIDVCWFTPQYSINTPQSESSPEKCAVWSCIFRWDFIKRYNIHFPIIHTMDDTFFRISCDAIPSMRKFTSNNIFYYHVFNRPGNVTSLWLTKTYQESAIESIEFYKDWYSWNPGVEKNNTSFYEWAFIDFRGFLLLPLDEYPKELGETLFRILSEYETDVKSGKVTPSVSTVNNYQYIVNTLTNYFHQ